MKTIIIYTTKYGSVTKAAEKLIAKLQGKTDIVNLATNPIPDLNDYDAVVLAGSIYMGKVQSKLRKFAEQNLKALLNKKVGLFVCAGEQDPVKQLLQIQNSFPKELFDSALAKETFGYEMDISKFSFFDKLIVKVVGGSKENRSVFDDKKIEEFAKRLSAKI